MKFIAAFALASVSALPDCHGNNGPLGINCDAPTCNGTNGPKDGPTGTPCVQEEVTAIPHYNTDPVAGRPYATTGDITRTEAGLGHYPEAPNHDNYNIDNSMTPAPYTTGGFNPGRSVQPLTPYSGYIQIGSGSEYPTPRPIGVVMQEMKLQY